MTLYCSASGDTLVYRYSPGTYLLKQKQQYSFISFNHSFETGKPGEPTLPYLQVNLLLPEGQVAESIHFYGDKLTEIPGEYILYPYQYSRPVSGPEKEDQQPLVLNEAVYGQPGNYPPQSTGLLSTQYLHGHPIALGTFTPVVYTPFQKKIRYYQEVTITIITRTEGQDHQHLPVNSSLQSKQVVGKAIQNPGMLLYYPPVVSDTEDYHILIVAPAVFNGHFEGVIDHYFIRGLKTKIINTEFIYATYTGQDSQEKIRNCIIHEYQNNNILHVMLAGDVEWIPARGFYAQVQSSSLYSDYNIPADLYYAALDGNWNTDGDNKWAEPGEDDLYPELSVGRLPVNTTAQLDNLVNKILHYQDHPVIGECRKPLMVGEKLYDNPITWGGDYMDLLIGLHSDNGYTTQGIPAWHNIQKLYDRDLPSPWTLSDLLAAINSGAAFIHHAGHSNTNYLMRMSSSSVTDTNFYLVNGIAHNYIPIYSHGCYCAAFDASDCIAEHMINLHKFAVAFVGNSRYGWFNEGSTEGPSEHLHREFVNALYGENLGQIGVAHTLSKINTAGWVSAPGQWEDGALRWCFYDCNVLGDPAMFLWTDKPMNLTVTHADTLVLSADTLLVGCDTANSPVEGLNCVLLRDTVMLNVLVTDSLGFARFPLSFSVNDTGLLTLIVSSYNCLPDTSFIRIVSPASISGTLSYDNPENTPLDSSFIYLVRQNDTVAMTFADSLGHYSFQNVEMGAYQLKILCIHQWGGATATDGLMIMRHFVHLALMNGLPLKAADVDGNHFVNTVDALGISRRFVGLMDSFPAGDWVFENTTTNISHTGETIVNIKGLCVGDVNKSFVPVYHIY